MILVKMDLQNALLIVLCLVFLLGVFTLSAQAAFENQPIAVGTTVNSHHSRNNPYATLRFTSAPSDYFLFTVNRSLYAVFTDTGSYAFVVSDTSDINGTPAYSGTISSEYNGYYYKELYKIYSTATWYTSLLSNYNTYQQGIDAIISSVGPNVPPAPDPVSLDYTLPPGNIAYIPLPSGASENITFTLTTTYYMAFGNNDTSRINQVVTVYSTLPSSSNNTAPSSPKIPWTNNGNVNLLGVSANKIYNGSIPSNLGGQYLVVANPLTMPSQGGSIGGDTYINGSISIHVSNVGGNPYIYPMSESLTITVGDGIGSESTYGDDPYTYVIDPDTGEIIWTDPNGGDTAPVSGGNNPLPSPNTIFDWLRNISQQLADFLRGPVQAVQTVVSAIRDFLSSFTQLYMWLPSPVYSLITSALMIAITIGVIKIFV